MKIFRMAALIFCLSSLAAITVCIFTDWNDRVYLPLALCLGAVGNAFHILSFKREKEEKGIKK